MENYIDEGYSTTGLEDAVDRVPPLIMRVDEQYVTRVNAANNASLGAASDAVKKMTGDLKILADQK